MTTTQSPQEPTPWTKQQVRDHWTLTKIHFWLDLPQWTAAQAADLIAGTVPDRESTETLEMLYGEFISLPPKGEDRYVVLKVKNKREKITIAARAHHMEEASPEEWLALAGSLGIAPEWRQLGIEKGLLTEEQSASVDNAGQQDSAAKVCAVPGTALGEEQKPWLIADPNDPEPAQPWYTPARYFARQLVIEESTLLNKPHILADKTLQSLTKIGIFKRGGKKPFSSSDTIKKAFSNVRLG